GSRIRNDIDKRSGLGQEHVGVRLLELEPPAHVVSCRLVAPRLDEPLERFLGVAVVETDVESRSRLARNQVDGAIAYVDRSELEVRRVEMLAAVVARLGDERAHQLDQPADRIVGKMRGGNMSLRAGNDEHAIERATPADLDGVAHA